MIDLILGFIFCYQINRMAKEKGISSTSYLLNYIAAFMLLMFTIAYGMVHFYGPNIMNTDEGIKLAVMFEPITISFQVAMFVYIRKRIKKIQVEEEEIHPTPPEKKDFSYFR